MKTTKRPAGAARNATYPAATRMADLMLTLSRSWSAVPLERLCDELGVSERTARRYRKAIDEYFKDKLGYEARERFRLIESVRDGEREKWFLSTPEELEGNAFQRLLSVYVSMVLLRSIESPVLQEGINELWNIAAGSLESKDRGKLAHFDRKFRCTGFGTKSCTGNSAALEDIINGIIHQRRLQIVHASQSRKKDAVHILRPYTLLLHRASLYLHAYDESHYQVRTFAIDRITDVLLRDETFRYPAAYDPDALLQGSFGIFEQPDAAPFTLRVRFAEALREYVTARTWHPRQRFSDCAGGGFVMEARITNVHEFVPWVLQFGSDAEVIEPAAVRERVMQELRTALAAYEEG